MKIKSQKDFFAGLMFMVAGMAFAGGVLGKNFKVISEGGAWSLVNTTYVVGAAGRMGPGYFPLVLGILLTVLGIIVAFQALVVETEDGGRIGAIAWKPLGFIIGANILFGILLGGLPRFGVPAMGMIVAIYGLTFMASLAGDEFRFREVIALATILAIGSYAAFVWLLKLQFPVWPSFIAG